MMMREGLMRGTIDRWRSGIGAITRYVCHVSFCPGRCVLIDVGRVGQTRDILRWPPGYGQPYVPLCGEIAVGDTLLL